MSRNEPEYSKRLSIEDLALPDDFSERLNRLLKLSEKEPSSPAEDDGVVRSGQIQEFHDDDINSFLAQNTMPATTKQSTSHSHSTHLEPLETTNLPTSPADDRIPTPQRKRFLSHSHAFDTRHQHQYPADLLSSLIAPTCYRPAPRPADTVPAEQAPSPVVHTTTGSLSTSVFAPRSSHPRPTPATRRRQQREKREAMEIARSRALESTATSASASAVSASTTERMARRIQRHRCLARLAQPKRVPQPQPQPQPKRARKAKAKGKGSAARINALMGERKNWDRRREELRKELIAAELSECTFQPKLGASKLVGRDRDTTVSRPGGSVFTRLYMKGRSSSSHPRGNGKVHSRSKSPDTPTTVSRSPKQEVEAPDQLANRLRAFDRKQAALLSDKSPSNWSSPRTGHPAGHFDTDEGYELGTGRTRYSRSRSVVRPSDGSPLSVCAGLSNSRSLHFPPPETWEMSETVLEDALKHIMDIKTPTFGDL